MSVRPSSPTASARGERRKQMSRFDGAPDLIGADGRPIEPTCNRDALLALAEEMEEFGNLPIKNPGIHVLQNDDFSRELGYARRIRRALGVSE